MSSRLWLLVEWVDERNVFPSYGVVNIDTLAYEESDLRPGKLIYIRLKHDNPRRAQILRITDNKQYVKQHKELMERQDQQVKNVLQLCMRTIKEMKSESVYFNQLDNNSQNGSLGQTITHVVEANSENSASDDSDLESNHPLDRSRSVNTNKSVQRFPQYHNRQESANGHTSRISLNSTNHDRRRFLGSSTPLPGNLNNGQEPHLCFDQGTQTEDTESPLSKIQEMETVLKNLYGRFQALVAEANNINSNLNDASESEQNDGDSFVEHNISGLWVENNNIEGSEVQVVGNVEIGAEQVVNASREEHTANISSVKVEEARQSTNDKVPRVRRMSAQTTNNIEASTSNETDMIPIGDGNATVPARLLNEIDWNSHTNATRQLLQAVFPRKVLATHSLTGKQSPAFLNRPPKKGLDPKLVEDIVKTVSVRCGVPKNVVRNAITIKCTDEAKLYRNRQQFRARQAVQNEENVPPSTPSSDESSNVAN